MSTKATRIRHFSNLFEQFALRGQIDGEILPPYPVKSGGLSVCQVSVQLSCTDEGRMRKFPGSPRISGASAHADV
jgi:hypothetical protein